MNRNPLMPFFIIAVIGIVLTVGMSYFGLNNAEKMLAEGDEPQEQAGGEVATDGEGLYIGSCAACHGQNLEGGVGPALDTIGSTLSADDIANVINNGQGTMPPGLVDADSANTIAEWLAEHQ